MSSAAPVHLLVVDDEPDLLTLYELTLVREGYAVACAGSVAQAWELLQSRAYHAVITDMRLPDGTGLELLRRLDAAGRPERVIVITAFSSADNAVEALKAGAFDYLTKPVDLKQFRAVVASAVGRLTAGDRLKAASDANLPARRERGRSGAPTQPANERLVGNSAPMAQVRGLIEKVGRSMAPVLIQGESGTGKELVARAVHEASSRAAGPFVAVNCGAIPENLLEAEFFGYRKGAFTGAAEDREGFFQAAEGGTLFLDEIGDLPLAMQAKLLRVVQERAVRPVGATTEQPTHVRIVSATHKDLATEVQAGRFRQDLFYRLNVIRIAVPPLRDRLEDLPQICQVLLQRIAADAGAEGPSRLSEGALQALRLQSYHGNVRELENLLHRALTMAASDCITRADLGLADDNGAGGVEEATPPETLQKLPAGDVLPDNLQDYLDGIERGVLLRALDKHRFNRTAAGESLGLSLRQMRYRMARLGVLSPRSDGDREESGGGV